MKTQKLPYAIIDVFAAQPLGGNPLTVVEGAENLPTETLALIAREFNLVETSFLLPPTRPEADWRIRSFTMAGEEVFGAGGHNSLGVWIWLALSGRLKLSNGETPFVQEIGEATYPLTVSRRDGVVEAIMQQAVPRWLNQVTDVARLASLLNLDADDIATDTLPAQVVDTGAGHLHVPLRTLEAVDRAEQDTAGLRRLLAECSGEGFNIFALGARQETAQVYTRFFNPTMGIPEDPATGTAAGPLAAHLVRHGLLPEGRVTIEQGTKLGRTSLIGVDVDGDRVRIRGSGVRVAEGTLFL
ncbi:MAG: PhzF family phenazine biosynthesis protein [Rhizobiaceae bacterium]